MEQRQRYPSEQGKVKQVWRLREQNILIEGEGLVLHRRACSVFEYIFKRNAPFYDIMVGSLNFSSLTSGCWLVLCHKEQDLFIYLSLWCSFGEEIVSFLQISLLRVFVQ